MKELIALAKAKPGELNFASSGVGAAAHLTMEMFKSRVGIDMQHVPYKGTAGALQDTVGGRINVMFDVVGPLMPQVRAGNVKALAVTAQERIPAAADVPTMAEQGVPDFISGTWAGIIAPAGTPKEIVDRVAAEAKKALADPAMKAKLAEQGIVAVGNSPDEYRGVRRRGDRPLGQGDQGRRHQDGAVRLQRPLGRHLMLRSAAQRALEAWPAMRRGSPGHASRRPLACGAPQDEARAHLK